MRRTVNFPTTRSGAEDAAAKANNNDEAEIFKEMNIATRATEIGGVAEDGISVNTKTSKRARRQVAQLEAMQQHKRCPMQPRPRRLGRVAKISSAPSPQLKRPNSPEDHYHDSAKVHQHPGRKSRRLVDLVTVAVEVDDLRPSLSTFHAFAIVVEVSLSFVNGGGSSEGHGIRSSEEFLDIG